MAMRSRTRNRSGMMRQRLKSFSWTCGTGLTVRAGDEFHAAVHGERGVERDPDAGDQRGVGEAEIGGVLVPGFFGADARRFDQRHFLEQHPPLTEELVEDGVQAAAVGGGAEGGRVLAEIHVFANARLAFGGGKGGAVVAGLEHEAGLVRWRPAGAEVGQRLNAAGDGLRAEDAARDEVAVAAEGGDVRVVEQPHFASRGNVHGIIPSGDFRADSARDTGNASGVAEKP